MILTPTEQAAFNKFRFTDSAILTSQEYHELIKRQLIQGVLNERIAIGEYDPNKPCYISETGKQLRQYQLRSQKKEQEENKRYKITTIIAATGAVSGIASLVWLIIESLLK